MKTHQMRPAFSMLTAIFVIVIMASVSIFVMSLSGKVIKSTTAQYQHEQATLYAKSYTEYAILAVTGNDRAVNCLQTIRGSIGPAPVTGDGYRVRTHIGYIGINDAADAQGISGCDVTRKLGTVPLGSSTPLTIVVDAYVDYKDPENPAGPWFTVHRRSVQKI